MVNDTTTLNGALSELGETMADNLESMGVVSADASDGLTTLAGKILDIEPSIGGLNLDTNIIIHSSDDTCFIGQSIMFWAELKASYDDETVEDVDLSGVLTGATVEFKMGNSVIGNGVTDSNGIASYTHTFNSEGVFNVHASFAGTDNFDACNSSNISVTTSYAMTITADKSVLSANDSDVATITAALSDGSGGVSGETLSYEILDHDDNVLDSGSDTTDSNGEISFSYVATGVGDVLVVVYYGISLQETFVVEDCSFYSVDGSGLSGTFTTGDGYITNMSVDTGLTGFTFPSNFELSYKYYPTNSGIESSNNLLWLIGASKTNGVLIGSEKSNLRNRIYNRTSSNNVQQTQNNANTLNTWNTIKITYNNGVWSISSNDGTSISYSKTFTPVMMLTYEAYANTRLKEIKIKAL